MGISDWAVGNFVTDAHHSIVTYGPVPIVASIVLAACAAAGPDMTRTDPTRRVTASAPIAPLPALAIVNVPRVDRSEAGDMPNGSSCATTAPPPSIEMSGTSHEVDLVPAYLLATPMAGRCRFDDCLKNGWDGDVRADCRFSDCSKNGWSAVGSAGSAGTDCSFGDCFKNGWTTRLPGGDRAEVSCNFGDCFKNGWTTRMAGERIESRCSFGDCTKNGWEVRLPAGKRLSCTCSFSDCPKNGASCR